MNFVLNRDTGTSTLLLLTKGMDQKIIKEKYITYPYNSLHAANIVEVFPVPGGP